MISIDADSGPLLRVLKSMYIDAVVVFVTSQTLLFRLALAILCERKLNYFIENWIVKPKYCVKDKGKNKFLNQFSVITL